MGRNGNGNGAHYESMNRSDVRTVERKTSEGSGGHSGRPGEAELQASVKIPLSSLNGDKMQNLRSA